MISRVLIGRRLSAKKTPSLFVSFLLMFGIVLACSGAAYFADWLLKPTFGRLQVYRHQTNTPGESCGDNYNNGPNPYADNFSYWSDADENTAFTCQPQQTIMQLQKPPSSPFPDDTASLTFTSYTGGNSSLPSVSDIATMGYTGFSIEASVTLLPASHTTQGGIFIQMDNSADSVFFLVDLTGFWHIALYEVSDYLNGAEILGGLKQELASGHLLPKKQQYLLQVQVDAKRHTVSFLIDKSRVATIHSPSFGTYDVALTLVCPLDATSSDQSLPNVCPVALTDFAFDVIH